MAKRAWGSGHVRQLDNGRWLAQWREGGQRNSKTFATEDLANRFLDVRNGLKAYRGAGVMPDRKALPKIGELRAAYLDKREGTHRAGTQDRQRWDLHMRFFDGLRPGDVNVGVIRRWVEETRGKGQSPSSVRCMMATLSGLFSELQDDGLVDVNPLKGLPPSVRLLLRNDTDHTAAPYVERLDDVYRIFMKLPKPLDIMFALGAYAFMRPGEAQALEWSSVDLNRGVIHVRQQLADGEVRQTKGRRARVVPVPDVLRSILTEWHLRTGGKGLVVRPEGGAGFVAQDVARRALEAALDDLGLTREGLDWYHATRHTGATHYMLRGGMLAKLSRMMGHASQSVTEKHYLHLAPDAFEGDESGIFGKPICHSDVQVVSLHDTDTRTTAVAGSGNTDICPQPSPQADTSGHPSTNQLFTDADRKIAKKS